MLANLCVKANLLAMNAYSALAGVQHAPATTGNGTSGGLGGISSAFDTVWQNFYTVIQQVVGTAAIATFVCSAFYFTIFGTSKDGLNKAKQMMIYSGAAIVVVYLGEPIVKAFISIVSGIKF